MNEQARTPLETRLEEATRWEGAAPGLWAKALDSETTVPRRRVDLILASLRKRSNLVAACLLIGLCGVIIIALLQSGGKARMSARQMPSPPAEYSVGPGFVGGGEGEDALRPDIVDRRGRKTLPGMASGAPAAPAPDSDLAKVQGAVPTERVVIRKATIELEAADVRGVFAKAAMFVSEAGGEYVQESSLTGGAIVGPNNARQPFYATLTLRVGVGRLSEVMNRLRDLATVTSENSGGEDVTAQAVDLEARIRNEERVEKELLELMATRKDSPLKEILELREQLSRVRERIELLVGQRDRLSHLASLATVLVIIREPNAVEQTISREAPVGGYFADRMATAWRNGLITLSNTISWLVGVVVGGAVWWIIILIISIVLVRLLRRPPAPKP